MQVNVYLHFNGKCEEAFKFYEQAAGGRIEMKSTYGESPMGDQTPPALRSNGMACLQPKKVPSAQTAITKR